MRYDVSDHRTGVTTAEQAFVFLGVEESTSDDFIITMYTAKVRPRSYLWQHLGHFLPSSMLSQVTTWTRG